MAGFAPPPPPPAPQNMFALTLLSEINKLIFIHTKTIYQFSIAMPGHKDDSSANFCAYFCTSTDMMQILLNS